MNELILLLKIKEFGEIKIELYPEVAPNTVANFVNYVENKLYDGLTFHRVIKGFMIQGGGSKTRLTPIRGEFTSNGFNNTLKHDRGVLSMARTNDPNSATSQFFIMHADSPHLDGQYAAFGKVIEGLDVVDKIASVKRNSYDEPLNPVIIDSFRVLSNTYKLPEVKY